MVLFFRVKKNKNVFSKQGLLKMCFISKVMWHDGQSEIFPWGFCFNTCAESDTSHQCVFVHGPGDMLLAARVNKCCVSCSRSWCCFLVCWNDGFIVYSFCITVTELLLYLCSSRSGELFYSSKILTDNRGITRCEYIFWNEQDHVF